MSSSPDYFTNHHDSPCSTNIETDLGEMGSLMPFGELISFTCNTQFPKQCRTSSSNFNISKTHRVLDTKEEDRNHKKAYEIVPQCLATNGNLIKPDEEDSKGNENSQEDALYGENRDRQVTTVPDRNKMPWKKRFSHLPSQPENQPTENSNKVDDFVSLKMKKSQKRKRTSGIKENEGNEAVLNKMMFVPSVGGKDRDGDTWIRKGVVVKTLQYGRPMATIIEVSEDKTACTLQFFSGWKAGVYAKFIAPV